MDDETRKVSTLLVKLGYLDQEKLQRGLKQQEELRKGGRPARLADVVLEMGLAKPEQVARVLVHEGTATLHCPKCRRRFTVPDFQATRRYKCAPCQTYLEIHADELLMATELAIPVMTAVPAAKKDKFEGRVFGQYRLVRRIAKGGMGAVYLGEQAETGQKVAVKILTEEYSKMPGIQARFEREGTTSGRLEHPNIVPMLHMGQEDSYTYIVTEFVEGGSLEDLIIKEKRLAPQRAVDLLCDVLAGLQHAHERGVVHRDIKPANVLLAPDGRARVIDFGLAKDAEAQTILTMAGNVMGTPSYMSPEQAKGERGGEASDQYSCGILLYLMLAGRKPFEGKSLLDTLEKQINQPLPSPKTLNPAVTDPLEKVLRKMTAKEPTQRYGSPAEAIHALRTAMGQPSTAPAPRKTATVRRTVAGAASGPPGRSRLWLWIVLGAALTIAAAAVWRYLR